MDKFICPINYNVIKDPIMLPCCGRLVSRQSILNFLKKSNNCPLCSTNFSLVDSVKTKNYFVSTTECINIKYLKKYDETITLNNSKIKLKAIIHKLDCINKSTISLLEIKNYNIVFNHRILIIIINDHFHKDQKIIEHILNIIVEKIYQYTNIFVHILHNNVVFYMKTNYEMITRTNRITITYPEKISDEINKICMEHNDINVSSLIIMFLTNHKINDFAKQDSGERSSHIADDQIEKLKTDVEKVWKKEFFIHIIKYSTFDFIDKLGHIYINIKDNDCIANKINNIMDNIILNKCRASVQSETSPIIYRETINYLGGYNGMQNIPAASTIYYEDCERMNILSTPSINLMNFHIPIIHHNYNEYWLDLTNINIMQNDILNLSINGENINVKIKYINANNTILNKWHNYLINEISYEVFLLSNQKNSLDRDLHLELLNQRSNALLLYLNKDCEKKQLQQLIKYINLLQKNEQINILKQYDILIKNIYPIKNVYKNKLYKSLKPLIELYRIKRCRASINSEKIFIVIGNYKTNDACSWLNNKLKYYVDKVDKNGSNALIVASSVGRYKLVKIMLDKKYFDLNYKNSFNYNALDMAMLYGYSDITNLLIEYGAKLSIDKEILFKICSIKNYHRIKKILLYMFTTYIDNIISGLNKFDIKLAITDGIYDIIKKNIDNINQLSWKNYFELFSNLTDNHLQCIEILLKYNKLNANEIINITIANNDEIEKEIIWPIFFASEKGNCTLLKLLLLYTSMDLLNKQNNNGRTALWIACYKKHLNIVIELISHGADINIVDNENQSPLIIACQNNDIDIVESLLDFDVDKKIYYDCILTCCQNGQYQILDLLLNKIKYSDLILSINYNPLLVSIMNNRIECIDICVKYGANVEDILSHDILLQASPLHIACFYGKLESVIFLCKMGANILSTSKNGFTPLHIAIKQRHIDIVKYILYQDGRLDILDGYNKYPIEYANEKILKILNNKLVNIFNKILTDNNIIKYLDILLLYGKSLSIYEYKNITNLSLYNGLSILSFAILSNNNLLIDTLIKMKVDIHRPDEYGIPPSFWMIYLDYPNITDIKLIKIVDKIKNLAKHNIYNKFILLNLNIDNDILLTNLTSINLLEKMNYYNLTMNNEVLIALKTSIPFDYPLFKFIHGLKKYVNNKELEYLIWESKIHFIRLIFNNENVLQPIYLMSIYLYTANKTIFEKTNDFIINWSEDNIWNPYIYYLYKAVTSLVPFKGQVYRYVEWEFNERKYQLGKKIIWYTFTICSIYNPEMFTSHDRMCYVSTKQIHTCKIIFSITSLTGRDISKYSKFYFDREIIFLPGTTFIIKNINKNKSYVIELEEIE